MGVKHHINQSKQNVIDYNKFSFGAAQKNLSKINTVEHQNITTLLKGRHN
jgi:hypothetical protein